MNKYYIFLYEKSKEAIIRDESSVPKLYGNYKPVNKKVVIKSIFDYSKEEYKFTTEFER
jgi:hypothetical protein